MVFAGGEEESWEMSVLLDAMGCMSAAMIHPEHAACAFDTGRDGFVIAGGGGMLVLGIAGVLPRRAAPPSLAELVGFGATSTADISPWSGEGAVRACSRPSAPSRRPWTTSTPTALDPVGDAVEPSGAVREVFGC